MSRSGFELTDSQQAKLKEWHNDCDADAGCIGGKLTYEFTPTGLGDCVAVKCICDEKIDLTESEDW